MSAVDEYLSGLDASTRATFEHIQSLALDIAPDAEEGLSHGMAALKYNRNL
jgi:hypothetical protein